MAVTKSANKDQAKQVSLIIPAGSANPAPPIGPILGQRGLNIMEFCKRFNDECTKAGIEKGLPIKVTITFYPDKSFEIELKGSPVPVLIKKALKLTSASKKPGTEFVGNITIEQITVIAKTKLNDMGLDNVDSAIKMVVGTCRSMGIKVTEEIK